ncbi:hypothetical protein NK718_01005 [Alsobacter sp. SYSU M60028]|uniref:Uncharacterized protein n=1 Tax=Alsobacter ponti TaxID=2962936 RepID=A0ABT1L6Q1_9HYPH|nr:hypothetical protein [Alsobacter ponti]MCP8937084.1 hypothetical protein [Alsobacter ponti]
MSIARFCVNSVALLAAGFLATAATSARAEDCTWGKPGYRDCIDAKIAKRREQEAKGQKPDIAKTVPASKRPGTLTPLPAPPQDTLILPDMNDARGRRALQRSLHDFERDQARMRRQGAPEPIMPYPEINKIPGQVCPTGGCY